MSKVIKVRIAVAVDPQGGWNAVGFGGAGEQDTMAAMSLAVEAVGDGEACYWIETELEVPEAKTYFAKAARA